MATRKTPAAKTTAKKATVKKATPAKKAAPRKAPAKKAAAKKAAPRRPRKPTARDVQVLELRRAGMAFDRIARQLKYPSREAVSDAYERALAESLPQPADKIRQLELDRLERLMTPLWPKAMRGELEAIAQLRQLSIDRTRIAADGRPLPAAEKAKQGLNESATRAEIARLHVKDNQLAATAVDLACGLDVVEKGSGVAATLARELRMTMQNLRALAGTGAAPKTGPGESNVVPESRLEQLRKKSAEESAARERARRG